MSAVGWYWLWQQHWLHSFLYGTLASEQCSQQTTGMLTKQQHLLHLTVSGSPHQRRHKNGHLQNGAVQTRTGVWVQRFKDGEQRVVCLGKCATHGATGLSHDLPTLARWRGVVSTDKAMTSGEELVWMAVWVPAPFLSYPCLLWAAMAHRHSSAVSMLPRQAYLLVPLDGRKTRLNMLQLPVQTLRLPAAMCLAPLATCELLAVCTAALSGAHPALSPLGSCWSLSSACPATGRSTCRCLARE